MSERGAAIRQRRIALGVSLRRLAKAAGIDRATITAAEEGRAVVRDTTYAVLEVTLNRLENPPAPPREMTPEEEAALLTLVRGGWLTFQWVNASGYVVPTPTGTYRAVPTPTEDRNPL